MEKDLGEGRLEEGGREEGGRKGGRARTYLGKVLEDGLDVTVILDLGEGGLGGGREGGREGGRTLGRCLRMVSMSPYFLIWVRADLGPMPRIEVV